MMTDEQATDNVHCPPSIEAMPGRVAGRRSRLLLLAGIGALVTVAGCSGGLPTPSRDVGQGQMMLDLTEALNAIRDQSASLQDQVDSLRDVIVRQDTIIRQLALTAGIPMPVSR